MAADTSNGNKTRSRGIAADEVRRHNLASVLEHLHLSGPASRSEITALTNLNRSTVADLIGELTSLGLVVEKRRTSPSGPGRPSPIVAVRPESVVALAVEMTVDSIAVATIGLGGHVFNTIRVARPSSRFSPETTVQDIARLAGPLLDSLPTVPTRFAGVGVAAAGLIRRSDGLVRVSPNLGWRDVPLGAMLASAFNGAGPVSVANEADLAAYAEYRRGDHAGTQHLIFVGGEVGVGTGVIINGALLHGYAGYAGEAGHTLIRQEGRECRCGARGCWETEAGESALLRHLGLETTETGTDVLASIYERARSGDSRIQEAIDQLGYWLGLGVGDLINTFNPELVVMGGIYHHLFDSLQSSMKESVGLRALGPPAEMVSIVRSSFAEDTALIGGAEMALASVVDNPAGSIGLADISGTGSGH